MCFNHVSELASWIAKSHNYIVLQQFATCIIFIYLQLQSSWIEASWLKYVEGAENPRIIGYNNCNKLQAFIYQEP